LEVSRVLTSEFAGVFEGVGAKKGPGLKHLDSTRFIQRAEALCSLRKDKGNGENKQRQEPIRRFWLRQNDDSWRLRQDDDAWRVAPE
jgi:hypothetical protein